MPAVIETHKLGRRFGARWAVRQVDLALEPGELIGIVGPDGAGKTTLLQMLAAILDPNEGECHVFGLDSRSHAKTIAGRLGYMTQDFTLYDRLSVDENLRLAGQLRDIEPAHYAERRERLLEMAGLRDFTARAAGKLSGGMRKKLSLSTCLLHEPELLILDEPGLGVDPLSRKQLWDMLEQFRGGGTAAVVATSYMDEASRCDRVLLLADGDVLAADTPRALRRRANGRVFELPGGALSDPSGLAAKIGATAVQALPDRMRFHLPAGSLARLPAGARQADPTLEDIFVLLTPSRRETSSRDSVVPAAAPDPSSAAGLRCDNVTVRFGNFRAVDNVSLELNPGELLALLGPNGAGKTTLIRALCGMLPMSGRAIVAGVDPASGRSLLSQRIGYMSQRFSLYLDLSPAENLTFFARAYGLTGDNARRSIAWATEMTGTDTDDRRLVADLSAAARQSLALACSVLHQPAVLFLDEPTSGVDPVARYRFWAMIRTLSAAGTSILVTTHYLDEARYCDRIGLMHQGRLIGHGTLPELRRELNLDTEATVEAVFLHIIERDGEGAEVVA